MPETETVVIDNLNITLKDHLSRHIKPDSRISIAGADFSMYAYEALKECLNNVGRFRFLFTSPAFSAKIEPKETRKFYIPQQNRERNLYGTPFEVLLRNKLTQRAVARDCEKWIAQCAQFRTVNIDGMSGMILIENPSGDNSVYLSIPAFTTSELGCEGGSPVRSPIVYIRSQASNSYLQNFDSTWNNPDLIEDITNNVLESMKTVYKENSPELVYYIALYNIFNEFLNTISDDELPNEATGFKKSQIWNILYNFQQDAALGIINKLEKFNGCILADSVGLGKTYTALAVIKYFEQRNKNVLVLCPKKLGDNWTMFKGNYANNPIAKDRLRYDVLFHTDLSREHGISNGLDLERLQWGNYDLVVIDESHNFRNGGELYGENRDRENRYLRLLNQVICQGVKTKVLMLSATPVNNRFNDLKNQLALAYQEDNANWSSLTDKRTMEDVFRNAQGAFNRWMKSEAAERTTENLLAVLDSEFFDLLDGVTIARSRKHIEKSYDTSKIGKFPHRNPPISKQPELTDPQFKLDYPDLFSMLMELNLKIYAPSSYILPSRRDKYDAMYDKNKPYIDLNQRNREVGLQKLMAVNLLKRIESSVYSFRLTLQRILNLINNSLDSIEQFKRNKGESQQVTVAEINPDQFDEDDQNIDIFSIGKKVKINLADMNYQDWEEELYQDKVRLDNLLVRIENIDPQHDNKLKELLALIDQKMNHPLNEGNKKILIFSAFADTVSYLYEQIGPLVKKKYGLNTAMITGTTDGRSTEPSLRCDLNTVLTCFSPLSKNRNSLSSAKQVDIDILIATDCISEGQNLQDCDYLVNYDIHWNPVRIIQRFGRIDRIGNVNNSVQLVNFWPNVTLDEYINLRKTVESRMKIVNITATGVGDDNPINDEQNRDLEYRKRQLERLKEEVVDIEDMSTGISLTDLGLNEFRLDLLDYRKAHADLDVARIPLGLHTLVRARPDLPTGVIFILKTRSNEGNKDSQNRIYPFYMTYINSRGEIVVDHLCPKKLLDALRILCRGKEQPDMTLCRQFNRETENGWKMDKYSKLLSEAINSIADFKQLNELDVFLEGNTVNLLSNKNNQLNDFELVCFFVVK